VPAAAHRLDQRYQRLYKPLLFMACLVPVLGCAGGILALSGVRWVPGFDLGVDPVRFVLDTLARTALNLLFATLLITPLRQLSGNAQLLRLRRMLGLFAFSYALLHFLTYLGPFQGFSWPEISKDILKRPFITIGFTALLLLVPLAASSTDRMMRRLGRRWRSLHRLVYVATALAVLHFWKMLKHEYRQPLLYACVLAALLGWRIWRAYRPAAATSKSGLPKVQGKA
jgi:methionine sulfoxide reductase heme-binding subunit